MIRRTSFVLQPELVALAVWALAASATLFVPISPVFDQMTQLWSAEAFLAGAAPAPNMIARVDLSELDRVRTEWQYWWAPGLSLIAAASRLLGARADVAFRIVALVATGLGVVGWSRWFGRFGLSPRVRLVLGGLLPLMPVVWFPLLVFNADVIVFGAAPWILVAALRTDDEAVPLSDRRRSALGLGAFFGLSYGLKYSIAVLGAGVFAFLAVEAARRRDPVRLRLLVRAGLVAALLVLPVLGANYRLTRRLTLVDAGDWSGFGTQQALALVGNWPYAIFDSATALQRLFPNGRFGAFDDLWLPTLGFHVLGFLGGLALLGLVLFGPGRLLSVERRLTATVVVSTVLAFAVIWWSGSVSLDVRHFSAPGLVALPLVVSAIVGTWDDRRRRIGRAVVAALLLVFALPGVALTVPQLAQRIRRQSDRAYVSNGIYNHYARQQDLARFRGRFEAECESRQCVWLVSEPWSGVSLAPAFAIFPLELVREEEISRSRIDSRSPTTLFALFFSSGELGRRSALARASWFGESGWQLLDRGGRDYELWVSRPEWRGAGPVSVKP